MKYFFSILFFAIAFFTLSANKPLGKKAPMMDKLTGSWMHTSGNEEQVLLFIDGYMTHTVYSKANKRFTETRGGTYQIKDEQLSIAFEFDTRDKEKAGQVLSYDFSSKKDELTVGIDGRQLTYRRVDNGAAALTGVWSITARMQDGKIVPIHRSGTRKTIKILSGSRFQWAAIDPGSKQFSGTGGGTYEFKNGKYTEHIEFFSRDSSRVGASLGFDGKLENGDWHHSGLSSKGDKIYEVWGKGKH